MNRQPLISVIVPVYNAEEYLRQCVESVLAQTYFNWELLLIDDGSTDSSGKICDEFTRRSARVKVLTRKHCGVSAARNAGLARARGEFVTFLDADDFLHTEALELLVSVFIKYSVDVVMGEYRRFKNASRLLIEESLRPNKKRFKFYALTPDVATRKILYQKVLQPSPCGKLFRRSLFRQMEFQEGRRYEDLDLIPKIIYSSCRVCWIPKFIYFYRQHSQSFLHKISLNRADALDVTAGLSDYFADRDPNLLKAAHDRELSANFNIFILFSRHKNQFTGEEKAYAEAVCNRTWQRIKKLRGESLLNRRARLRNKMAIIASYLGGRPLISFLARFPG